MISWPAFLTPPGFRWERRTDAPAPYWLLAGDNGIWVHAVLERDLTVRSVADTLVRQTRRVA